MNTPMPKGFLWGAATSAYQIEGSITNNWSEWEKTRTRREHLDPALFNSGIACDSYNRYKEDIDLLAEMGLNAYRFSIEWSRIEPEEGKFDEAAVAHYREVLEYLKSKGIRPFVTLWHWTIPVWLDKMGGLENPKLPFYLDRYTQKLVQSLCGLNEDWLTLNEPDGLAANSFLFGRWPPQKKSPLAFIRTFRNLQQAHRQMARSIKTIDSNARVGLAENCGYIEPYNKNNFVDVVAAKIVDYSRNYAFLDGVGDSLDFVGLNYYRHSKWHFFGERNTTEKTSDMGWELYPEGIYYVLRALHARYHKPIYITEHGLADAVDSRRGEYIKKSLRYVAQAIGEGTDIRGYFHWSLIDNFEWAEGYSPRFGLIEIDREHGLQRKPRPSTKIMSEIARNGFSV